MPKRTVVLIVLFLLSIVAAVVTFWFGVPLRGQFGNPPPVDNTIPPDVLDALCGMPIEYHDVPYCQRISNGFTDWCQYTNHYRGPAPGPGCLLRRTYHDPLSYYNPQPTEGCYPRACDGTRNSQTANSTVEERGACDVQYSNTMGDCSRSSDITLKYGEYCPENGEATSTFANCCDGGAHVPYNEPESYNYSATCASGFECRGNPPETKCSCPVGSTYQCIGGFTNCGCTPVNPPPAGSCGDGTTQANGADGIAGTSDDEECDTGSSNVPLSDADQSWFDIDDSDVAVLRRSNCLETCKKAQCSDGRNNDNKNGIDGADAACKDGVFGGGTTHLQGYNKEDCPICEKKESQDDATQTGLIPPPPPPVATVLPLVIPTSSSLPSNSIFNRPYSEFYCSDNTDIAGRTASYIRDGVLVDPCQCDSNLQICFPNENNNNCQVPCAQLNPTGMWHRSCPYDRGFCPEDYRCAWYGELSVQDIDFYRCRKLIVTGELGCRSKWDCKDNYVDTDFPADYSGNMLRRKQSSSAIYRCIGNATGGNGKCCDPRATDQTGCGRTAFVEPGGNPPGPPPACSSSSTGGAGNGLLGGGFGGDDAGEGGGEGDTSGGGASSAASGQSSGGPNECTPVDEWLTCGERCSDDLRACQDACGSDQTCRSACGGGWQDCVTACGQPCQDEPPTSTASRTNLTGSSASSQGSLTYCCINNQCVTDSGIPGVACPLTQQQCTQSCGPIVSSKASTGSTGSTGGSQPPTSAGSAGSTGSQGSDGSAGSLTSGASKSSGSSKSGSSKSGSISSKTSVSCMGDECVNGGNEFCIEQGMTCQTMSALPCFVCKTASSHASTLSGGSSTMSRISAMSSRTSSRSSVLSGSSRTSSRSSVFLASSRSSSQGSGLSGSSRSSSRSSGSSVSSKSSSTSSKTSSASSRTSSRSSSHASNRSSSSVLVMNCSGYECGLGGDGYCAFNGNQRCINTANNPCFLCLPPSETSSSPFDPTSSTASVPAVACNGAACVSGGASFCGRLNFFCNETNAQPCFVCSDEPPTVDLRQSDLTIPPSCLCNPNERCVDNVCLLPDTIAQLPNFCGNARVDPGELCDQGSLNSDQQNASCRTDCTPGRCGDGILDTPLELCDDGNVLNGDGCSSVCAFERPAGTLPGGVVTLPYEQGGQQSVASGETPTPPKTSDTGPAALAIMIAGAAAGVVWMRRKRAP